MKNSARTMKIAFFAPLNTASGENGRSRFFTSLFREMVGRGHFVSVYEAFEETSGGTDETDLFFSEFISYPLFEHTKVNRVFRRARKADIVIIASGSGHDDAFLEEASRRLRRAGPPVVYWETDMYARAEKLRTGSKAAAALLSFFDLVITCGGGETLHDLYRLHGAADSIAVYPGFDTDSPPFAAIPGENRPSLLGMWVDREPAIEKSVWEYFFLPARICSDSSFLLAGRGWDRHIPEIENITRYGGDDFARFSFLCRALLVPAPEESFLLGHCPSERFFDTAGMGCCLIANHWEGIDTFFKPGQECLVAHDGFEVASFLRKLSADSAREIGHAAQYRVYRAHTYAHRARQTEQVLRTLLEREKPAGRPGVVVYDVIMDKDKTRSRRRRVKHPAPSRSRR